MTEWGAKPKRQRRSKLSCAVDRKLHSLGPLKIDATLLKLMFFYDPGTGDFIRLLGRPGSEGGAGTPAGNHRKSDNYWQIWINGRLWLSHRLAWFIMTGKEPEEEIDHINLDKSDNRWSNLRLASHSQNQANSRLYKNNTSGFKGVQRKNKGWSASVRHNKVLHRLGVFPTPEQAHEAYCNAANVFHGEFARSE